MCPITSTFSTGLGYLVVMLRLTRGEHDLMARFGWADALLIVTIAAFLTLAATGGRPEAAYSSGYLLGNLGFLLGFGLLLMPAGIGPR